MPLGLSNYTAQIISVRLGDSEKAADAVRRHVAHVGDVTEALFKEFYGELLQYADKRSRAKTEQ